MPATPDDLCDLLTRLDVRFALHRHPPLHTVAQSRALRGEIDGLHTKNLFLRDKPGRLFLLSAAEDARLDLKTAHVRPGGAGRMSFASADKLLDVWGVAPGAVTPFGAINDPDGHVTVALDRGLLSAPRVNFHPLTNEMTLGLAPEDLLHFLRAVGHEPLVVAMSGA
jgi:Ala-tRNA(Pro) deacylase